MSSIKACCQTSLFSILISFCKWVLPLDKISPILSNMHKKHTREEGWGVSGKVISATETVEFGDTWLVQKLFLFTFYISYISPQFQLLAKEASRIFHRKKDWLSISISFVVYKQYVSFKRSLFLLELLELHKLLSFKGNHKHFWSWKVVICVKINKNTKVPCWEVQVTAIVGHPL